MRSAGCVALWLCFFARTWPLGLDFVRSGVILERPGSIFEAERAVFSMLLRARARAQRTCCECASDTLELMFCAHQSCRATRHERRKIERKSICEPSGTLFHQGRAKNSSRVLSKVSWRRPRTSRERRKPSRGRPGSVRGPSRARPRAVLERSGSAPRVPGSPKVAPSALRIDFCSNLNPPRTVPGASQERPESHFGMIFVLLVRSFVRAVVCCFVLCWFVRSLVRWFAYTQSANCARATKRKTKRAGFALRPSFCRSSFGARPPRITYNLRCNVLLVAPR